jgi:hypothetical protein
MIRKTVFTIATVAALGAAALAPTEASAKGLKGGHGWGWGVGLGIAGIAITSAAVANCYQWVETRYGLVRVNTCY